MASIFKTPANPAPTGPIDDNDARAAPISTLARRRRGDLARLAPLEAERVLAPDDEEPGPHDDRGTNQHFDRRHVLEDDVADDQREQERSVFERRDDRDVGSAIGFGEKDLADAAGDSGADEHGPLLRGRPHPAEGD